MFIAHLPAGYIALRASGPRPRAVAARHDWWVMNFLTHWTFGVELALCAIALALLIFRRRT